MNAKPVNHTNNNKIHMGQFKEEEQTWETAPLTYLESTPTFVPGRKKKEYVVSHVTFIIFV